MFCIISVIRRSYLGDKFASQGRVDSFYICFGDHNAVVARGIYQKPEMLVPSEQYMQDTLLTPPPTKNSGDSVEGETPLKLSHPAVCIQLCKFHTLIYNSNMVALLPS